MKTITIISLLLTISLSKSNKYTHNDNKKYCDTTERHCEESTKVKYIFYDVNPAEGFNLRRDVYMRFAIMLAEAHKSGKYLNWRLVLPPWYRLYHWHSDRHYSKPKFWRNYFSIAALKSYAPVLELDEVFDRIKSEIIYIDRLYVIKNYDDAFEGGVFTEKWNVSEGCLYNEEFWGFDNIEVNIQNCLQFQGKISQLWNVLDLNPKDKMVMFTHGEIPLHDSYGTRAYWDCRKSMKFNKELINAAKEYILENFNCVSEKCNTYASLHWRRQDFTRSRHKDIPSIKNTAEQLIKLTQKKTPIIKKVYVATDASKSEQQELLTAFTNQGYKAYFYKEIKNKFDDGALAIIDQIICSHAALFVGTSESTFTFRIEEEREILGFDSDTTFNRLCPDNRTCPKPSIWKIVQ